MIMRFLIASALSIVFQLSALAQSTPSIKGKILATTTQSRMGTFNSFSYYTNDGKILGLWSDGPNGQSGAGDFNDTYTEQVNPNDPNVLIIHPGKSSGFMLHFQDGKLTGPFYHRVIDPSTSNDRINISNRGYVVGGKTCIAGFTSTRGGTYLIRAMGKSLESFSVDATDSATFSVFEGQTQRYASIPLTLGSHTNLLNLAGAFPPSDGATEAIIVAGFGPGTYTVVGRGGQKAGDILVEVYELGFGGN